MSLHSQEAVGAPTTCEKRETLGGSRRPIMNKTSLQRRCSFIDLFTEFKNSCFIFYTFTNFYQFYQSFTIFNRLSPL